MARSKGPKKGDAPLDAVPSGTAELTSRPATYFTSPMELVRSTQLRTSDKLEALKEWEFEVRQLDVATEENMWAGETTTLQEIHEAMRELGHEPEADAAPGGKAG